MLTIIITIISSVLFLWNGQMNSRYSIKWSLKTSLISAGLKEFLWSGNCVPVWLAHGWLQAKILSIFQAVSSASYCFSNVYEAWSSQDACLSALVFLQMLTRIKYNRLNRGGGGWTWWWCGGGYSGYEWSFSYDWITKKDTISAFRNVLFPFKVMFWPLLIGFCFTFGRKKKYKLHHYWNKISAQKNNYHV